MATRSEAGPTAYINARLLDPRSGLDETGALFADQGVIRDVGPRLFNDGLPEGAEVIDCAGACLAPGLVDMRVQLGEPGQEHKETIETASKAAAAGGIASMVALPNTDPVVDDVAGIEFIARRAREEKLVKVYGYGAVTRRLEGRELVEMGLLSEYGALGFTDGLQAVADAQVMRRALSYSRTVDTVILQHPQEPSLATGAMNSGELATRLGLSGNHLLNEVIVIERDLRLVEMTGGRYHVANVTCAESLEVIRRAKARGLPVTASTAPHYFTLNETAVGDYRTFAKMTPPLRSEPDREALAAAVADGTIDAIASDHSPHDQDAKRLPFNLAEPGIVGLLDLLRRLTDGPAGILKGRADLTRGLPCDLVIFDPERPATIDPDRFLSKSKNSPFEGHMVQGAVLRTVVDGRSIFTSDLSTPNGSTPGGFTPGGSTPGNGRQAA